MTALQLILVKRRLIGTCSFQSFCGVTKEEYVKPQSRYEPNYTEDYQSWPQLQQFAPLKTTRSTTNAVQHVLYSTPTPPQRFQIQLPEPIDHITFVFYKRISFEVYINDKEQTATNKK